MKPFLIVLILLGLYPLSMLAAGIVVEGGPMDQSLAPTPDKQVVYALAAQDPYWNAINIEDDVPRRLLKVPVGKRFVLTDIWFLSREEQVISSSASDRIWLESRHHNERFIVFDSPKAELPDPLRWETGIVFPPGAEMWINYRAADRTDLLRRVLFTGYFEAVNTP